MMEPVMEDLDTEQNETENRPARSKLVLPFIVGLTICLVIGFFTLGYVSLTKPAQQTNDYSTLNDQNQQANDLTSAKDASDDATDMVVKEDGTFDFAQYRYFSFPLPFVVNFADGNGMMAVEIAIATYETTLRGERLIEKLTTFSPKLRSTINLIMAEQTYKNVDTVAKRKAFEKELLDGIIPVIDGHNSEDPSGITDLHITKFVISGTR